MFWPTSRPVPPPVQPDPIPGTAERMPPHEVTRVREAAHAAKRLYPGAVGELIQREVLAWATHGAYRADLPGTALMPRVVHELMTTPTGREG